MFIKTNCINISDIEPPLFPFIITLYVIDGINTHNILLENVSFLLGPDNISRFKEVLTDYNDMMNPVAIRLMQLFALVLGFEQVKNYC